MKKLAEFERWQLVLGIIGIVIPIVGGWWSYRTFVLQREDARNLSIMVQPCVIATETDAPMMVIDTVVKNIGKVAVSAGERGIELTVIEYNDRNSLPQSNGGVIDWYEKSDDVRVVVNRYNLLRQYGASTRNHHLLNPGVEFREPAVVQVSYGKLYGIRARFFVQDVGGTMSDFHYFYVQKETKKEFASTP